MTSIRAFWLLGFCLCAALAHASAIPPGGVGYRWMSFEDPLDGDAMQALAFYPAAARDQRSQLEGYDVDAAPDLPIAAGQHPLLMLSHGNTGTPLALHDLITHLAKRGFVVVAVIHPGDNAHDHSRLGTLSNLYGRPLQISAAITVALADPFLAPALDPDRVGMIGYSAGGETALILSGAQPALDRLRRYCAAFPDDKDACRTQGELVADRDDLRAKADPRIHALLLMAPLALMFGRHELAGVQVPTLIYSGDHDQLLRLDKNAAALARKLPIPPVYKVLPGAGHFVFMAPCNDQQATAMPALCKDGDGVDRRGIHRDMVSQASQFFGHNLAGNDYDYAAHP